MRHTVNRYYGIQNGWAPFRGSGRPRVKADAERLAAYWRRIDPLHCYKAVGLSPELPALL